MATICLQKGHCFRTRGATGTFREQEFADKAVNLTRARLAGLGHSVHTVLADTPAPYPRSDLFVAFHLDGSTDQNRRGASVGYPDEAGAVAARAWKRHHSRLGFPGGFLRDNYTAALSGYYGYGRARAPRRFLAEHGTATNPADRTWLFDNLDLVAQAHVDAIGEILGHPSSPPPPPPPPADDDEFRRKVMALPTLTEGAGVGERAHQAHYVRILQALLVAHAEDLVPNANAFIDGALGASTVRVLRSWQSRTGRLPADGVCDGDDWAWLCGV